METPPNHPTTHHAIHAADHLSRLAQLLHRDDTAWRARPAFRDVTDIQECLPHLEAALEGLVIAYEAAGRRLIELHQQGHVATSEEPDSTYTAEQMERALLHRAVTQQALEKTALAARRTTIAYLPFQPS